MHCVFTAQSQFFHHHIFLRNKYVKMGAVLTLYLIQNYSLFLLKLIFLKSLTSNYKGKEHLWCIINMSL